MLGLICQIWGVDMNTFVAQEGGDHYQAEYQHWDWVLDAGLGYLDGCATKYVSRWWKKNGLQDVLKAKTYLLKMLANFDSIFAIAVEPPHNIDEINDRFVKSNRLPPLEADFCECMSKWEKKADLEICLGLLEAIITKARRVQEEGAASPSLAPAPMVANTPASPAPALPCGAVAGTIGQAAPANSTTGVSANGMEHPFGYDEWSEGPVSGFHSIRGTKTEDGYNG